MFSLFRLTNIALTRCSRQLFSKPPVFQGVFCNNRINHIDYQHRWVPISREFHASGSKIHYLDFRHRFPQNLIKKNMLIIRRQKMKKHKRIKWRRKFKMMLVKRRLKREIGKEKAFRVELLTIIRQAEMFDPREYAMRKIAEIKDRKPKPTKEETLEEIKELIRKNRYQVDYIKPNHRKAEF